METVIDLKDLLKHEITDLYSAEQQIIEALPLMIEKAGNGKLKTALKDHLKVTKDQKARLDEIKELLGEPAPNGNGGGDKKPGFFSRLFGGSDKCKGMEGLITEGEKMMSADMSPEAADAAIIASAQKIEHYEISGYGTARAFARELNLGEVANKLEQTLNEEYAADDLLTKLAVGKINIEAEFADGSRNGKSPSKLKVVSNGKSNGATTVAKKSGSALRANLKSAPGKSHSPKSSAKSSASQSSPTNKKSLNKNNSKVPVKTKTAAKNSKAKSSKTAGSKSSLKKSKSIRRR
ncbi:MAG: ferritin-like domain-containing protein [Ginsengibacter sp.]